MLNKNYIKLNTSKYVVSILIVKKSNDEFRMCVDYKTLNAFTIKNRNVFSLIKNILIKLCFVKYYNKFDIIAAFNEIKMRKNDEKKTIFLIKYELFEYVIMSFELCNASKTFQSFINVTFHEYLNDFCTNYMNDIFIYFKIKKKHVTHVFKVFERLQKIDLYFDIKKCEFFAIEIKYLNLIITTKKVKMNSNKINAIVN